MLEGVELVVKSPGVPGESPLAAAARRRGIPLWSEVELGYRLLPAGARLIGVTGTNGKTTTTELLGAILRADERPTEVAGNVGRPLTDAAEEAGPDSWVVCELSSFQLEDVDTFACDVAVLLNLEPDHLDRHGSFEAYRDAKLRIFERARANVVPRGFGIDGIEFSADDELPAEPLIPGRHNRENAAAATAAARAAGVPDDAIAEALRTFAGVPHRLELVRELRGVRWVNDSKATNTAAARRGVAAYDAPLHLILGGSLKGEDFGPFARDLPDNVASIHLDRRSGRRARRRPRRRRARVRPRRRPRHRRRARGRRRAPGRHRSSLAGVRELRPVRELRGTRRHVPPPRRGARMSGRAKAKPLQFEWNLIVLVTTALVLFGLVMVYSATSGSAVLGHGNPQGYVERQALFALVGLVALFVLSRLPLEKLRAIAPTLLVGAAVLCVGVLAVGSRINGARRWVDVGPLAFQPSEFAKLALVVWVAAYLSRRAAPRSLAELMKPVGLVALGFAGLVLFEPDLGTALVIMLVVGAILLVSGTRMTLLVTAYGIVIALAGIAVWAEPYRRARLLTFLDPWKDPTGAGLQNVQALISLGSGGIFGAGLGNGTAPLRYLPEAPTDMMAAVIGGQFGLLGMMLVFLAFGAFAYAGIRLALACKDPFAKTARRRRHRPRVWAGCDQHRGRCRSRTADRNPASVPLLRGLEPHRDARLRRRAP